MRARNDRPPAIQMLGRVRVVERCCIRVQLHVARIDPGAIYPWIVEVVLASLNQEDLQVVIEIGEPAGDDAACAAAATDNDVDFVWDGHPGGCLILLRYHLWS